MTLYQTNPNLSADTIAMMVERKILIPTTIDHEALARGIQEVWTNTDNTVYDCAMTVLTDELETATYKETNHA